MFPFLNLSTFHLCFRIDLKCYIEWKKLDYLCYCKSEISDVCNVIEGHCLLTMKIVHIYANGCFDWLIFGQQSINSSREAISIVSGKYERFMFVHPVDETTAQQRLYCIQSISIVEQPKPIIVDFNGPTVYTHGHIILHLKANCV